MTDEPRTFQFSINLRNARPLPKRRRFSYSSLYAKRHWYNLSFGGEKFRLSFHEKNVDDRWIRLGDEVVGYRSFSFSPIDSQAAVPLQAVNWLGVVFGEEMFIVPGASEHEMPSLRGRIIYSQEHAQEFLDKAFAWEKAAPKDKWRLEVLNAALGYYHIALRTGLNATPVTQGIFAMCLEALATAKNYSPDSRGKFGAKGGPESFFDKANAEDKAYLADVAALKAIRDIATAHFGAHQLREREKLAEKLNECYRCKQDEPSLVEGMFSPDRVLDDIQREAWWLYLMSLNLVREAFSRLIGASSVMVAEKDLWPLVFNAETAKYHPIARSAEQR